MVLRGATNTHRVLRGRIGFLCLWTLAIDAVATSPIAPASRARLARALLDTHGLGRVRIELTPRLLSDHDDGSAHTLRLFEAVARERSVAALGIAAHEVSHAYPGRQVVAMSGDGGLAMLLGELLTVAMHQLPVKIVTFNNSSLGMIKLEMMVDGLPDYQTDNGSFDYAAIARAIGIDAVRAEQPGDVRAALTEAFAQPGPALVDLVTDADALSIPPHITAAQAKGFALAAGRIVLDGGVGKMVELARANVRNIPRPAFVR